MSKRTFEDVLKARHAKPPPVLSQWSQTLLSDAVGRLIQQHYVQRQFFSEVLQGGSQERAPKGNPDVVFSACQAALGQLQEPGDRVAAVASQVCATQLLDITAAMTPGQLLSPQQQNEAESVIAAIKKLQSKLQFHQPSFDEHMFKAKPPLAVWTLLDKAGILPLGVSLPHLLSTDGSEMELCLPLEPVEVLRVVQPLLEQEKVAWQRLLPFLALFLVCFQQAPQLLSEYIRRLLGEALEAGDAGQVTAAFLLARQACAEGPHVFPTYSQWFQQCFGDVACSLAATPKAFSFLIRFLTSIVPGECAEHLKVQVLRPPAAAPRCREILADYVALAKTRLADLKEPLPSVGNVEISSGELSKELEQAQVEVERALAVFQSTGKVPSSIMESSIFRKPYFIGRFLPALMKPRPLPDKPDVRMRMIGVLVQAGKVPASLHTRYLEACQTQTHHLLEGVFDVEEDVMKDLAMPPWEQLRLCLQQLTETVGDAGSDNVTRSRAGELISLISEKITAVLNSPAANSCSTKQAGRVISLQQSDLNPVHVELVEAILNMVCYAVSAALPSADLHWLRRLVLMLVQHSCLHRALFASMESLLTHQCCHLQPGHVRGLAALLASFSLVEGRLQALRVGDEGAMETKHCDAGAFVDCILTTVPSSTGAEQIAALRLFTSYLNYVFLLFETFSPAVINEQHGLVPAVLTKRFQFLGWRLLPALRGGGLSEQCWEVPDDISLAACALLHSQKFHSCSSLLSLQEWAALELAVAADQDCLPVLARLEFLQWAVWCHYLPLPESEGGCGDSIPLACSTLMEQLVLSLCRQAGWETGSACAGWGQGSGQSTPHLSTGVLSLLQELVLHLGKSEEEGLRQREKEEMETEEGGSWLLQQFHKMCCSPSQADDTSDLVVNHRVIAFLRVAYQLPAYLLFVNHSSDACNLAPLTTSLETHLGSALSEACFLPLHLTLHLLQGFCSLDWMSNLEQARKFLSCPLVITSVMVHWSAVQHLCLSDQCYLFEDAAQAREWADRCITDQKPPPDLPSRLLASALFAACLSKSGISEMATLMTTKLFDNEWKELAVPLVRLLLVHFPLTQGHPSCQVSQTPEVGVLLRDVLVRSPEVFVQLVCGNAAGPTTSQCPSAPQSGITMETKAALSHCRLLSVVGSLQEGALSAIASCTGGLQALVMLYHRVLGHWHQMGREAPTCTPVDRSQVLDLTLSDLVLASGAIKAAMSTAPLPQLASLDPEMVKSCGHDFLHIYQKRSKTHW